MLISECINKVIDTEKPTVFVGGIPKNADIGKIFNYSKILGAIKLYVRSVCPNAEFHLVTDSKSTFILN